MKSPQQEPPRHIDVTEIMHGIRASVTLKKLAHRPASGPHETELGHRTTMDGCRAVPVGTAGECDHPRTSPPHQHSAARSAEELLAFHDREFVDNAYLSILNREPDKEGAAYYLQAIRSGSLSRIEILGRLRYSTEGRSEGVKISGLMIRFAFRLLTKLPILGYLVEVITLPLRLPFILRRMEHLETSLHAEQTRLRDASEARGQAQDQSIQHLAKIMEDFSRQK